MSATVAAALKKIAVAILTDKKARKVVLGIILGILIILVMPLAAIIAIFNGDINIDANRLQTLVVQNMSAEEQARLQRVEDLMYEIEDKMTEAGFDKQRVKEAQVLYVLALSDFSEEAGFVDKLVGCFAEGQTDAELIAAVNAAFGTNLSVDEFTKVMSAIRAVYISTAGYIDPSTKNNLDLVQWAKNAHSRGWGYVWGTYGQVLTRSLYKAKAEQYPDEVGGYADFIEEHWIGGRTADCVGLIKGYGWFDPETGKIEYGTNGMPDIGADTMYANAEESGTIDTIPEIPGLAVWHEGHIGIYIGNGHVIHASGTKVGVIQTPIGNSGWTHWLKIPYKERTMELCEQLDVVRCINEKENGLDLIYGVDMSLSEGQAQRFALIRALLWNAPFLVLDEPFSALDDETAAKVAKLINDEKKMRGVIVVTHKYADYLEYDYKINLHEGEMYVKQSLSAQKI